MIRTTSLRAALNDMRAEHAKAAMAGGPSPVPKLLRIDDGTTLRIAPRIVDGAPFVGKLLSGQPIAHLTVHRYSPFGRRIGTEMYIP